MATEGLETVPQSSLICFIYTSPAAEFNSLLSFKVRKCSKLLYNLSTFKGFGADVERVCCCTGLHRLAAPRFYSDGVTRTEGGGELLLFGLRPQLDGSGVCKCLCVCC